MIWESAFVIILAIVFIFFVILICSLACLAFELKRAVNENETCENRKL